MNAHLNTFAGSAALLVLLASGASAQAQTSLFSEDFGTGASRSATANPNVAGFTFLATGNIADDHYAIVGNGSLPDPATSWSEQIPGYAADNRVMVVNAGNTAASMYSRSFTASVNHTYTLSAKRYIINGDMTAGDQNGPLAWSMQFSESGNTVADSAPMNSDPALHRHTPADNADGADWQTSQYSFAFVVDPNCAEPMKDSSIELTADLINRTQQTSGNDFYVDDIELVEGPVTPGQDIPSICVKPPPAPPAAVPTLGPWALGLLAGLLGFMGYRRRRSNVQ